MKKLHFIAYKLLNWVRLLGKHRHHYHIKQSKKVILKLQSIRQQGADNERIMLYLRKIHPATFEELILTLVEQSEGLILRNTRYTGDGGIDGKFSYRGDRWIIQAKRYASNINPKHVTEFAKLIIHRNSRGLFVHTGKTGGMSKSASKAADIWFLSGPGLVRAICQENCLFKELVQYN